MSERDKKAKGKHDPELLPVQGPSLRTPWLLILVVVFLVQVFCVRYAGFKHPHQHTFDEGVYLRMGAQMTQSMTDYSTKAIYDQAAGSDRKLPEHYNKPLFVHPPVFSFLISLSYRVFGMVADAAFVVSALAGLCLIVLAYLIGDVLFDRRVGFVAGLLMSIEPVAWLCSQKIWMETTLAAFMMLSLYLFCRAMKKPDLPWMIACGIAAGFAVLTKYPGALVIFAIVAYAVCCDRSLLKKSRFYLGLSVPLIMFLPWVGWNCSVYGTEGLDLFIKNPSGIKATRFFGNLTAFLGSWWWALALVLVALTILVILGKRSSRENKDVWDKRSNITYQVLFAVALCIILVLVRKNIVNSFRLHHVPNGGWKMRMFHEEPWYFYLGRLVELSPFYLLSYLSLALCAIVGKDYIKKCTPILVFLVVALLFFILWGGFQCRYITSVVVPLMVLSAGVLVHVFDKLKAIESEGAKRAALIGFALVPLYFILKTLFIGFSMAMPNSHCYF